MSRYPACLRIEELTTLKIYAGSSISEVRGFNMAVFSQGVQYYSPVMQLLLILSADH